MGKSELKDALQRKVSRRCEQLWQDAESQVAAHRAEVARQLQACTTAIEDRLQRECRALRRTVLSAAMKEAAVLRLQAESALAEQLRELAGPLLAERYTAARARYWRQLHAELPASDWQRCLVHADDVALASTHLPAATVVVASDDLGGGLIAEREDGRVRIDNSLEQRLARCWPGLLPQLLDELRSLVESHAAAQPDRPE